jgi:truncated hemoglobin YjbI
MGGEPSPTPTLYNWAGGGDAFHRLIDAFYDRVEADELLSPFFPGGVSEQHRAHVTAWWCEVFGGPARYTQQLGGYESMLAHHRGLGISPEQRFRFASLMSLAAERRGTAGRSGVPLCVRRLRRVGNSAGHGELAARSRAGGACPRPALGLGRRTAVSALTLTASGRHFE